MNNNLGTRNDFTNMYPTPLQNNNLVYSNEFYIQNLEFLLGIYADEVMSKNLPNLPDPLTL